MQKKKGLLPRLRGISTSERYKALAESYNKLTKPKADKLMESEILTPEDIEYLQTKGLLEVDEDSEEVKLTAKGIKYLQDRRVRERPQEYELREGEEPSLKTQKLTDYAKEHQGEAW